MDCLIPARSGSKGIPKKNIVLLRDIPLIAYTIFVAKNSKNINNVYVSTDSDEIAEIARFYGALTPFLRPKYLASDKANDREVFCHFFNEAKKLSIPLSTEIIHLRPTTPGRDIYELNKAISNFKLDNNCSSMRSAHESELYPHKWFNINKIYLEPVIKSDSNVEITNLPRQSFPKVFIPNGYIDIVRNSIFKFEGRFHGEKIMPFITKPAIDIDNFKDLELAKEDKQVINLSKEIKKKI